MKRNATRLCTLILTLALLLQLAAPAFAAMGQTAGNTTAENQRILNALTGYSGDAAGAGALLDKLGLLDDEGNLIVNQSIRLDGVEMTLDQVEALLADPGTDLSRTASVDGYPVTLENLKIMLQIERELQRLKDTYFSGDTFGADATGNLNSLMSQIENEGISMFAETKAAEEIKMTLPSVVQQGGGRVSMPFTTGYLPEPDQGSFYISYNPLTPPNSNNKTMKVELYYNPTFPVEEKEYKRLATLGTSPYMAKPSVGFYWTPGLEVTMEDRSYLEVCAETNWHMGYVEINNCKGFQADPAPGGRGYIPVKAKCNLTQDWSAVTQTVTMGSGKIVGGMPASIGIDILLPTVGNDTAANSVTSYVSGKNLMAAGLSLAGSVQAGVVMHADDLANVPNITAIRATPRFFSKGAAVPFKTAAPVDIPVFRKSGSVAASSDVTSWATFSFETAVPDVEMSLSSLALQIDLDAEDTKYIIGGQEKTYAEMRELSPAGFYTMAYTKNGSIKLTKTSQPIVDAVKAPAGTYTPGQVIPITVIFRDSIKCDGLSITVNGKQLSCSDSTGANSLGSKHVFEYTVQPTDNTDLVMNGVTGQDIFGCTVAGGNESRTIANVTLRTARMQEAVTTVTASKASLTSTEGAAGVDLTLALQQGEGYTTKYADYDKTSSTNKKAPFIARREGQEDIPFLLKDTGGTLSAVCATGPLEFGSTQKTYIYQILAYEQTLPGVWSGTPVNTGKSVTVTVAPMVFVNGLSITASNNKTELSLTDTDLPKLGVNFTGNPTHKTGAWNSSDTNIATIAGSYDASGNPVGTVTPVGLGKVTFTFTADNGNVPDGNSSHVKEAQSIEYTVTAGAEAGIVVPKGGDSLITIKGSPVQVRWYGNLAQSLVPSDSDHVTYTVEVFEGNITDGVFEGKTPVETVSGLGIDVQNVEIPGDNLTAVSVGATPSYTVRISAPHPYANLAGQGIKLYAYAYIIVNPIPVKIKLTQPESLYRLDSGGAFSVSWALEGYDSATTPAISFTVEKISEDGTVTSIDVPAQSGQSGTVSVPIAAVTGERNLRDLYVVTAKARANDQSPWSSDSYQLYVYNSGALDITLGAEREKKDTLTISNRENPYVVGAELPTTTDGILALRDKLGLSELIGINYDDYAWSALKDGIRWESQNDKKVSLNFRQGSRYEDLSRFGYDSYLPGTTLALAGLGETEQTTITAIHANTGMSTTIDVKVESLENRFYLLQMTPMLKTKLTYTDGKGMEKTVETNDKGTLALYEPDGIASPIRCRATDAGDGNALYLGTLSNSRLRSGEGNSLRLELYPLNTLPMRKVASATLYLKNPDGTPYVGNVTVRGGVYKNGGYCQEAQLGVNSTTLKGGKVAQTVTTGADGKISVTFDSTQFWSEEKGETGADGELLSASDQVHYLFELTGLGADGTALRPALVQVDGVSAAELSRRSSQGLCPLEQADGVKPFVVLQQNVETDGITRNVRDTSAVVGPNQTAPKGSELVSTVLLWGENDAASRDYAVNLLDEFGFKPTGQKSEVITYPFSSIPVVKNTMSLTPANITGSGWVPEREQRGLKLQVLRSSTLSRDIPLDIKAADLSKAPKLEGETAQNILVELTDGSGVGGMPPMNAKNDKTLNKALEAVKNANGEDGVDGSNFKLLISPGPDAATFKALIWAGYNSLGLEDADYQDGVFVQPTLLEDNADEAFGFGAEQAAELAAGGKGAVQSGKDLAKSGKSTDGGGSMSGQLEGYYEALIKFNFRTEQWEIHTLGGGFTVGFGFSIGKSINQMVGPIPVTASFELGAAIQLDFKMASRYKVMGAGLEWETSLQADSVSDFLTTLRIYAYFEAFGGFGFDLSIIALKIGIFGRVTVDNSNAFLSRPYLATQSLRQTNGQAVQLTGEVGLKFVLKFIGIEYEAILASIKGGWGDTFRDWDDIQDYWANTGSGLEQQMTLMSQAAAMNGLATVSATARLESRDYLDDFDRAWLTPKRGRAIDAQNGLAALQTNAYPHVQPQVTDDGHYLLYTFDSNSEDVEQTRIYATTFSGGTYPQGNKIAAPADFEGFGDSSMRLAGTQAMAAAAWIRQSAGVEAGAGDELDYNKQAVLTNATEIVASVNTGSGWTSTRITDNGTPDLAPVVAVGGDKAIVAWRSVYASEATEQGLTNFDTQDNILCRIYDKTSNKWGDPMVVYNGSAGAVKGIEAAMLPDGTAAITYTLDRIDAVTKARANQANTNDTTHYEVATTIVNGQDDVGRTLMLTNDTYLDENPQIVAVDCGTGGQSDPRFVIGWHSIHDGVSDIRMAALDSGGLPSATFPESLTQIAQNTAIGLNFKFVAVDKLENLSVIWSASNQTDSGGDVIRAVKFLPKDDTVDLSAPIPVANMPANTVADWFDAYVDTTDTTGNTIKAVLQGTEYLPIDPNNESTYTKYEAGRDENGQILYAYVPKEKTVLYTATETYKNKLTLDSLWVDYPNLIPNSLVPVRFTVTNSGMDILNSVKVTLGGVESTFTVNLAPNDTAVLTCYHATGAVIEDADYTLTPTFEGTEQPSLALSKTVYLAYPDVGIAGVEVIGEDGGNRDLRVTLYNSAPSKLADSGSTVKVAFWDNADCEGTPVIDAQSISDDPALALMDNGAYSLKKTFNLDAYLTTKDGKVDGEIPESGQRLYAKAWIEKNGEERPEVNTNNNLGWVQMDSLLYRAGEPVTITVDQSVVDDKTKAVVTVRNNSLKNESSGNLLVELLDDKGNLLETKQSYTPNARAVNNGLITLTGEQSETMTFPFSKLGASVRVTYGVLDVANNDNAALGGITLTGVPLRLSDFVEDENDPTKLTAEAATAATDITLTLQTKNPNSTVTVNGKTYAPGMSVSGTITIVVTAPDNTSKMTYVIKVTDAKAPPPSSGGNTTRYAITAKAGEGGTVTPSGRVTVSEGGSKTFTITPDQGYEIQDVLVDGVSVLSSVISSEGEKSATYTFEKVAKKHTIEAKFTKVSLAWADPFPDVKEDDWFYAAARFAQETGLMQGVSDGSFAPTGTTTRGTMVTLLYRRAGSPKVVPSGRQWYADGQAWALENGVSDGRNMEDVVTREQLVTMLWRNAGSPKTTGNLSAFPDANQAGSWAVEALGWAVETGLLTGKDGGRLDPLGLASRAETAMIFMRMAQMEQETAE